MDKTTAILHAKPTICQNSLIAVCNQRVNIPGGDKNLLVFSFPEDQENGNFGDRVLTFQEYIPKSNDPNVPDPNAETYPVYLVRDLITDGNGVGTVYLKDLPKKVMSGSTITHAILRTDQPSRELAMADFDRNGMVDVNDANALEATLGFTGNSRYDIASEDPNDPNILYIGTRPDKKVDANDTRAFYQLMAQDEARREEETP